MSVWGDNRIAVRIGPGGTWNSMSDSNPAALFDYVAEQLNRFALAYLHIRTADQGRLLVAEGQIRCDGAIAQDLERKIIARWLRT